MSDDRTTPTRRTVMKGLSAAGLAVTGAAVGASAASAVPDGPVAVGEARAVAREKMEQLAGTGEFDPWRGADLGEPTGYHAPVGDRRWRSYRRSAYVFPVRQRGETVGHITASARREWAPVLEYSRAAPPSAEADRAAGVASDLGTRGTGRLLYTGGLSYGYELDDGTAVHLVGLQVAEPADHVALDSFSMVGAGTDAQWEALDGTGGDDVETNGYSMIYGVPSFTETGSSDDSGGPGYPNNVGTTDDPWDSWDGCIPYAGANVVGFHEGIDNSDWSDREALIDRLHHHMETSSDGWTEWNDIAPGIEDYSSGSHSYDAYTPPWLDPGDMKTNIENDEPFILNMNGGGKKENKDGEGYGDHSVATIGYDDRSDGTYWALHDGWVDYTRWLQGGNWEIAKPTFVHTQ